MPTTTATRPAYEEDYHAWALDQAERLRALARDRPNEPIDWELLAEEVEGMGRSERRACESFLVHIVAHLLKIDYARDPEPIPHWVGEIVAFRGNLERSITPTIERALREDLAGHYRWAVKTAEAALAQDPTFLGRSPRTCPYGYDQVVGDWLPERARTGHMPRPRRRR